MLIPILVLTVGSFIATAQLNEDQSLDKWTSIHSLLDQDRQSQDEASLKNDEDWRKLLEDNFENQRWKRAYIEEVPQDNILLSQDEEDTISQDKEKRFFSIFRSRPPKSEGYKRGPGFRSWGGKRGDGSIEKRQPEFSMAYQQMEKRGRVDSGKRRFQSWGGKRAYLYAKPHESSRNYWKSQFLNAEGKRKFSSWGGKRSGNLNTDTESSGELQSWEG